jgi:hypothetical protein
VCRAVALALVALSALASTAHAHPGALPVVDGAAGPGALLLALLAVLAAGGVAATGRGLAGRRVAAATAAGTVVVALTLAAPHLVHHALDADQGASCASLRIAGGVDATPTAAPPVVLSPVADVVQPLLEPLAAPAPPAAAWVRAPPA